MNYKAKLGEFVKIAEAAIEANLPQIADNITVDAMRYAVMGGGKRLRPVILLASAEAFSGDAGISLAEPFAAAIEMIHTYSLIHDDLPAMDDDDYRRGRLSCHKKFGEAYAILAGDALLNRAFECIFKSILCNTQSGGKNLIEATAILADASGVNGMISGQNDDIFFENTDISEQTLININKKKTGALISASFQMGAIIGGADEKNARIFAEAGEKTGMAFQIRDDVLDIEGDFETLGKLTGSDKKNNKTTYASLFGKQRCTEMIAELTAESEKLLKDTRADVEFLIGLIRELADRNV